MPSTFFRRVDGLLASGKDGFVVGNADARIGLDPTGWRIWQLCEYPVTTDHIVARLTHEFDVAPSECRDHVVSFLDELVRRGLMERTTAGDPARDRYLWLLKRALTNRLYVENEQRLWLLSERAANGGNFPTQTELRDIRYDDPETYRRLSVDKEIGRMVYREPGRYAHTMNGLHSLTHVERLTEDLLSRGVDGDFVDAGTWRGGIAIFMRALQHAHGVADRKVWVADSFSGVPKPTAQPDVDAKLDLSEDRFPWMAASRREVQDNFALYELLDEGVEFLPGLFADTLPTAPIDRIALLRFDGDLYGSTVDCLTALYDRVSPGGHVIIDDYALAPCKQAVDEFRAERGITAPLHRINWSVVHWQKAG